MNRSTRESLAAAALVVATVVWGASFLFGKLALAELHVAHLVLFRSVLATLVLLPFAGRELPAPGTWRTYFVTGFLMIPVTFLLQFAGLELTTATSATLIVGAMPPALALGAALFAGERVGQRGWVAVAASTLGVALVAGGPGGGHSWAGDALVLLSLLVVVVWVLTSKRLLEVNSVAAVTAHTHAIGTLTLVPIALAWGGVPSFDLSPSAWASIAVLGLGCSALAYALWNWALRHLPASQAGMFANIEPLVGVVLGATVLGESLDGTMLAGGALIVGSAVFASLPEPGRPAEAS